MLHVSTVYEKWYLLFARKKQFYLPSSIFLTNLSLITIITKFNTLSNCDCVVRSIEHILADDEKRQFLKTRIIRSEDLLQVSLRIDHRSLASFRRGACRITSFQENRDQAFPSSLLVSLKNVPSTAFDCNVNARQNHGT